MYTSEWCDMFLQSFEVHLELAPDYACAQGFAKLLRELATRLLKNVYSINPL